MKSRTLQEQVRALAIILAGTNRCPAPPPERQASPLFMKLSLCLLLPLVLCLAACENIHPGKDRNAEGESNGLASGGGLQDAVVLIIRHAEKPDSGPGLSAAGQERAQGYVQYFTRLATNPTPLHLSYLVAAADSPNSHRPHLTVEPLSRALGLELELNFSSLESLELARELRTKPHGKHILICWRHGKIPDLVQALGVKPTKLLPHGIWPEDEYGWVLQLRFDQKGHLIPGGATRIAEGLRCPASIIAIRP